MQAWLDSQSTYQLSLQKAKQAADAAAYASQQVEKLNSALTTAQSSLDAVTAQTADEKNGVLDERALIKELMSNVGKYFSVQFFFSCNRATSCHAGSAFHPSYSLTST